MGHWAVGRGCGISPWCPRGVPSITGGQLPPAPSRGCPRTHEATAVWSRAAGHPALGPQDTGPPTSPPPLPTPTPPAQEPPLWPRGAARDGLLSGPLCTERCGAIRRPSPARPWHCSGAGGAEDAPGRGSPSPKGRASVPSAAGTGGSPGDVGWGTRGRPAAGPAPPWSVRYINIEAVCPSVCLSLYIYIYVHPGGAGAGPSLVPGLAAGGAVRRGVEDGHAAAAGADDVGDEAAAVAADVAQDRALGVDVGELLFHAAPARALQRAVGAERVVSPQKEEEEEEAGRKAAEGAGPSWGTGLTGRFPSCAAAGLWPAVIPGGSRSPVRRQGCEPASWKASSSAGACRHQGQHPWVPPLP